MKYQTVQFDQWYEPFNAESVIINRTVLLEWMVANQGLEPRTCGL